MWKDFSIILSEKTNWKILWFCFSFPQGEIYIGKNALKVSTYPKMLLVGGTGDEVYFMFG